MNIKSESGPPMRLFEITTNLVGYSYVRAYAWAKTVDEAKELFEKRNPHLAARAILPLFAANAAPFCTLASDEGWEA